MCFQVRPLLNVARNEASRTPARIGFLAGHRCADMRLPREEGMLAAPPPHHVVGAFVLASDPIKQEKA
jgi:hypothetical protein